MTRSDERHSTRIMTMGSVQGRTAKAAGDGCGNGERRNLLPHLSLRRTPQKTKWHPRCSATPSHPLGRLLRLTRPRDDHYRMQPGDIFVPRNVANVVNHIDLSLTRQWSSMQSTTWESSTSSLSATRLVADVPPRCLTRR